MGSNGTKYRKPDENSNNSVHSVMSSGSQSSPQRIHESSDTAVRGEEKETEHFRKNVLRDINTQEMDGRISRGGVAYHVTLDDKTSPTPADRRYTHTPTRKKLVQEYSSEDKSLMAEIMREEMMSQRVARARQYEARRAEAERRRQARIGKAKAQVEQKQHQMEASEYEKKSNLEDLAARTRENRIKASNGNTFYF